MCTKPIQIKNNSKYITTKFGKPFYIWVNCGHCEECIKAKQTEWNLRTYYETIKTLQNNGFLYFDTLTYSNKNLPRIGQYLENNKNYPCFRYQDIRYFYESLRQKYKEHEKQIRYFVTCEYGSLRNRPHMHIILFITAPIEPLELSEEIGKIWKFGRTDGRPYKSKKYVLEHNTIKTINLDAIRYVAKYVNKSTHFMTKINERWLKLEKWYKDFKGYDKLEIKRRKRKYFQLTTPFHRQSQHYGENALDFFDLEYLLDGKPFFYRNDDLKILVNCQLPMYYKRKIFQEQIKYNGKRMWINNELGIEYKRRNEERLLTAIFNRLKDANFNQGKNYTDEQLKETAKYILFERGRTNGKDDYRAHHEEAELFNYNTDKDLIYLGKKCISKEFAGNDIIGYCTTNVVPTEENFDICQKSHLETIIEELTKDRDTKQLTLLKEHLNEIRKIFFQKGTTY